MLHGHPERSQSGTAVSGSQRTGGVEVPDERFGGAGIQDSVYVVPALFDVHSNKAKRVLLPDPSNGLGNDVLCVQLCRLI